MSSVNEILFTSVPTFALLCNIFLLFTLITAKKSKEIKSFMALLVAFILWCAGSLCMRLGLGPGTEFWWEISLTGLFLVPYLYYLLATSYTKRKGSFIKLIYGIITTVLVILNFFNVFVGNARMEYVDGEYIFKYDVYIWSLIPILFSIIIIISIVFEVRASIMDDMVQWKYIMPLLVGMLIMLAGVLLDMIPAMNTFPNDTLACMINACLIYYAFCKKRIYAVGQVASSGAVFILSLVATAALFAHYGDKLILLVDNIFGGVIRKPTVLVALICSIVAVALYILLNSLLRKLFIRESERRNEEVRRFSVAVNSSLEMKDVLSRFYQVSKDMIAAESIHIAMFSESERSYIGTSEIGSLDRSLTISADNPVIDKLKKTGEGVFYDDFKRSSAYRGMWEAEKKMFESVNARYILPFMDGDHVMGVSVFSGKSGRKSDFTYEDISFLSSLASVASMVIKNARLYAQMKREANCDLLTGAYNRRALIRAVEAALNDKTKSPVTLILFNLDDFSLYNELYGEAEGDRILKGFTEMIRTIVGARGLTARYSGKEFGVLLPQCDSAQAVRIAEDVRELLADTIEKSPEATKKFLTFSAGICTYPYSATNMNQLISYANMAVFRIKQKGKNDIAVFTVNMKDDRQENKGDNISELYSTIYALTAAIDAKDHYTFNHSQCVSKYAVRIAQLAGLNEELVEVVRQAGLLHDIGKIGIPDAILSKEGILTDEEFSVMRQHVERSIEMIRHLPDLDYVIPAVLGHHEKYDGTGYPRRIKGEYIPIGARCLSIADAFDAMVSKRSYKYSMSVESALEEIERNKGTQFDPWLADIFVNGVKSGSIEVIEY
ncbi:MAG: diguanylate cyclase [Parasporobacterium sp.]|nr:diguanylate cyclase [Parasporobacterium sp.]